MKKSTDLGVSISVALLVACVQIPTANAQEDDVVGTWSCSFGASEEGMTMSGDYEYVFDDDQSFEANGQMTIELEIPDFAASFTLELDLAGTWRLESMTLYEILSKAAVSSASEAASPIEAMIVQQLQAEFGSSAGQEEALTIVALTDSSMTIDDGTLHECDRV